MKTGRAPMEDAVMGFPEQPVEGALDQGGSALDHTVQALISDVDEFLSYIAIVKTPEVDAIRDRLQVALRTAKQELLAATRSKPKKFKKFGELREPRALRDMTGMSLVRRHAWIAIGVAAALGALVGSAAGMARHKVR